MANRSKPVAHKPPEKRDPEVSPEIWGLPQRVEEACRDYAERTGVLLDQQSLATAAKLTQGTISKLLAYKTLRKLPADTVVRIAKATDVSVDWLLRGAPVTRRAIELTPAPPSAIRPSRPSPSASEEK